MASAVKDLNLEQFQGNEIVFRLGDPGDSAYVIESGSVEILLGREPDQHRIHVLGQGDLFGEIALLDGKPRSATVRTLTPTRLVRIQREHVQSVLLKSDAVVQYLVQVLLEHVRRADAANQTLRLREDTIIASVNQLLAERGAGALTVAQIEAASGVAGNPAGAPPAQTGDAAGKLNVTAFQTLTLAQNLSEAIDNHQLELHYQPIIRFQDRKLAGFEALIRWRHPVRGMVRPDEFIALAEKTGLIHRIGHFVLTQAISDWGRLRPLCSADAAHPAFMSINLSAPELCQAGIVEQVESALKAQAMDPAELRIELTETAMISNLEIISSVADRLRTMGVGIALDDFGKGYAGLDALQSLPFSCLKVDKAFVDRMHASSRSLQIIRSTLDMARLLGMTTVAEGIEDQATGDLLAGMGCVYAQGYHFARPMPADAVMAWKVTSGA